MNGTLHRQLQEIVWQIEAATARAAAIATDAGEAAFARRPVAGAWSAAECLAHLNLTTKAFLPLIDQTLANAMAERIHRRKRFRKDLIGWFLAWTLEPPYRIKMKTRAAFVPGASGGRAQVLSAFEALQADLMRRVEAADGYDIGRVKVTSPFNARLRYNVLSAFSVMLAHERRHLWQAERALAKM